MLEFLVQRERKVDTQTEVATRRMVALGEKDDGEDQEHEANLEEALAGRNRSRKDSRRQMVRLQRLWLWQSP